MRIVVILSLLLVLLGCESNTEQQVDLSKEKVTIVDEGTPSFYGTLEPMASENVYFLMTDRFVDGDPNNNYPEQGGMYPTWRGKLEGENGQTAYVGYLGGDFKGILNKGGYLKDLGFTAIWLTPIVSQPDQDCDSYHYFSRLLIIPEGTPIENKTIFKGI